MFRAIFGLSNQQPTTVLSVSQSDYDSRLLYKRGNGILVYSPQNVTGFFNSKNNSTYDIVLPLSISESIDGAFSLYRSNDQQETEELFIIFNRVIPDFVKVEKKVNVAKLQEVCDIIRENKSWNIAHVYAHLGKARCFEEQCVQVLLNEVDDLYGMTPLMISIAAKNLSMVQSLLSLKCSLDSLSVNQNSVLHHAATSSKDIINCLLAKEEARKYINNFNADGHTPLHIACISDEPDIVKALLISGADANVSTAYSSKTWKGAPLNVGSIFKSNEAKFYSEDMKYGGTPLHWCFSIEVIETLLNANCDINAENLQGKTALYMMVKHNRLDCVVLLLCNEADSSRQDNDGNTVVHEAVQSNNIEMLQALVVFGANVNIKNNKGETARHLLGKCKNIETMTYILHVAGALRCPSSMQGCTDSCSNSGTFDGNSTACVPDGPAPTLIQHMMAVASMEKAANKKRPLKGGRLLCLDGGGIRGLILIQILLEIEAEFKKPLIDSFDWVAGTSTGGILALALSYGLTLRQCQKLYFKLKDKVFNGDRPYSHVELENLLKENFGPTTKMSDIKKTKLIITTVQANQRPLSLHLLRNYPAPLSIIHNVQTKSDDVIMSDNDEYIWEVARKSSAAPTYFNPFNNCVDGGLIANNPTLDALTEIMEYSLAQRVAENFSEMVQTSIVVSCGTGLIPVDDIQFLNLNWTKSLLNTIRMVTQIKQLGTIFVDLATCTDGRVVDRARAWCSMGGIPYYRFNPQMSKDVSMDEKSNLVIIKVLWETKAYMFANKSMIKEVVDILSHS